jgi:hypothetical protein
MAESVERLISRVDTPLVILLHERDGGFNL